MRWPICTAARPIAKPENLSTSQLLEVVVDTLEHGAYPVEYALRCVIRLARDLSEEAFAARVTRRVPFYRERGGER